MFDLSEAPELISLVELKVLIHVIARLFRTAFFEDPILTIRFVYVLVFMGGINLVITLFIFLESFVLNFILFFNLIFLLVPGMIATFEIRSCKLGFLKRIFSRHAYLLFLRWIKNRVLHFKRVKLYVVKNLVYSKSLLLRGYQRIWIAESRLVLLLTKCYNIWITLFLLITDSLIMLNLNLINLVFYDYTLIQESVFLEAADLIVLDEFYWLILI